MRTLKLYGGLGEVVLTCPCLERLDARVARLSFVNVAPEEESYQHVAPCAPCLRELILELSLSSALCLACYSEGKPLDGGGTVDVLLDELSCGLPLVLVDRAAHIA